MTEAEWLVATDPAKMLDMLKDKASDRKSRMFAIACCRHISHLVDDVSIQDTLSVAERIAEGEVPSMGEVQQAVQEKAFLAMNNAERGTPLRAAIKAAIHANLHPIFPR